MQTRTLLTFPVVAACSWLLAVACGLVTAARVGSETHFLEICVASCPSGLSCLEGACTRECNADVDCTDLHAAATCAQRCRVHCESHADCTVHDDHWLCVDSECRSSRRSTALDSCSEFPSGVQQPADVQTTFEDVPDATDVVMALADADGLYWIQESGAVHALARGAAASSELRPAAADPITVLGLLSDETTLYWLEAGRRTDTPPSTDPPPPPSLLYAVPKAGGTVELVTHEHVLMFPVALHDTGVIVRVQDRLYRASSADLQTLAHIPATESGFQVADGVAYWLEWSEAIETWVLLAASLEEGPVHIVSELEGNFMGTPVFSVAHGRVLWAWEDVVLDPLASAQKLMMLDLSTGCVQELPSLGERIGQGVRDQEHVYWRSFQSGGFSPGDEEEVVPFVRVNLTTGAFQRLVSGFDVTLVTDPVAQDEDAIYFRRHGERSLVRVLKPD